MKKITVNLPDVLNQEYSIFIDKNLLEQLEALVDLSNYSQIAIVTDINLKSHLEIILNNLKTKPLVVTIEAGEEHKTIDTVQTIWNQLIDAKCDRKTLIINLGGGVIGDMGGFVASTYMRGIDFINIPTTLLSQVDASVGGKTGIDFAGLKNLIGTFNQPKAVIIDIETIKTLPDREFVSGFGEIVKHGLIIDKAYFQKVVSKKPKEFSEDELIDIIANSCDIKKGIVENDPKEMGIRKILNFGHTIGHAIEALSLDTNHPLLHGEAISLGMIAEAKLSQLVGNISDQDVELIKNSLENSGLPINIGNTNAEKIFEKIAGDKKNSFGEIRWTLLKQLGEAIYDQNVNEDLVKKALEYVL